MNTQDEIVAELAALRAALEAQTQPYLDTQGLAQRYAVSTDWIYDHASELGGVRLGRGPKAAWRFRVTLADERLNDLYAAPQSKPPSRHSSCAPSRATQPRRPARTASGSSSSFSEKVRKRAALAA